MDGRTVVSHCGKNPGASLLHVSPSLLVHETMSLKVFFNRIILSFDDILVTLQIVYLNANFKCLVL